ncbi:putative transferase [Alternaria arborescens]|uniref:putative transferase n=1 Tax=Alternaria arborescens TaxID=156630 RepID=UPI001074E2D3|nr:putative transferase [Alternaria arborescens]RYN42376.1 putative transferase [Alternaria arborescens]RYO36016.1 putative transferase [Alternaria arborescens]
MAALSLGASRKTPKYICDACRTNVRCLPRPAADAHRTFSTASSSNDRISTRPIAPSFFRNRADIRPSTIRNAREKSSGRPYSIEASPQAAGSNFAALPHRRLISLTGPHTVKFLQGLITNKVEESRQSPFYAAFLDARGRVLWDVFVWVWPKLVQEKEPWACYIEVDESEFESLKKHLKRHKLRSKVQISDVSADEIGVWAAWGSEAGQRRSESIIAEMSDPRCPDMRRYLASANTTTVIEGAEPVDVREYHLQRYRNGIPEGPQEIARESALPMECNIDLSHGIDFKKGCYVGQELTIRTKHTGIVRKRILPVHIDNPGKTAALPEHGTDIKQLDENGHIKKGRAAGKFIRGIGDVGLALCRLENMTSMKISAEGGTWKPGMEFGCETNDGIVKLNPILHDWFVQRERELWDKNRLRL